MGKFITDRLNAVPGDQYDQVTHVTPSSPQLLASGLPQAPRLHFVIAHRPVRNSFEHERVCTPGIQVVKATTLEALDCLRADFRRFWRRDVA